MAVMNAHAGVSGPVVADNRYETLVQLSPDALYVLQHGRLVFINAAGARQLRAACADDLLGLPLSRLLHPDYVDQGLARIEHMLATGKPALPMEQKYLRCDGTVIDVEVCSAPFIYEGGPAIQVIARDITDRKLAQEALQISRKRYQTLLVEMTRAKEFLEQEKAILEMIALDRPLAEVLRESCLAMQRILPGGACCSIALLDSDGIHVRIEAAPSLPEAWGRLFDGLEISPAAGACGASIYWNRQVISDDIEHDPLWEACRADALSHGLRACWSIPIATAFSVALGAINICCPTPRSPEPEHLSFISDVVRVVGIAIHKEMVERSLQESEERYRSVVTSLAEGILVQSRDGTILTCNPSAEKILRAHSGSLAGTRASSYFRRMVAESGSEIRYGEFPSEIVLRTGQPLLELVVGLEMQDGDIVWISENILPIRRPGDTQASAVLLSFTDITAVIEAQQRLRHMATHDALTELPNRALLIERLAQSLALARGGAHQVAVLFLDLDRFKNVNDTLGHQAGDELLKMVAARLVSCIRGRDTLARFGGDEFVILAEGYEDVFYPTMLSERILRVISEPFRIEDNEYYLGVSIGIGVHPHDGDDGATLLRCADSAMYFAKESGRNHYRFFTAELNARAQRRYFLERNLRRALAQQEFHVHYQAKIDLKSGKIVGAEALLRWSAPDGGMAPTMEFIRVAEETGLIVPIGKWVLEQACRQAVKWRDRIAPELRMAVNLSPRQFREENLVSEVMDVLRRTGMPPCALEFEITESLLMRDTEKLMQVLEVLTDMGIRFSVDDFGTGYSSLSYLQRFPIGNLKIDRSFITGIPENRDSVALVQAIIAMARALHMSVTAEGVERQAQAEFLERAGCQEMQGFLLSEPVTADAFENLLRSRQ